MDTLIPAAFNGVGVISVFAWLLWMIATGRLVTRRENDATVKRAEKAEENVEKLTILGTELIETAKAARAMYEALRKAANTS